MTDKQVLRMTQTPEYTLEEIYREALMKIKRMQPKPIGDSGFVHGPQLLFDNCQRIADLALKGKRYV